jgi:ubiquinone/menaquinone biosynthesis C-methylase UbiE
MLKFDEINKLRTLFKNGENVIQYIKANKMSCSVEEAILYAYDLQAGTYVKALSDQRVKSLKEQAGQKLASLFRSLGIQSFCEAGVGEGTTFAHVLGASESKRGIGFDISVSRLLYAQRFLKDQNLSASLFASELSQMPFADNAVECLYTFHSVEPNGGREKLILSELLRVARNYLVLVEPDYDRFDEAQKKRMEQHGYVKHLEKHLRELGANVIRYEPWELDVAAHNRASLFVIEKKKISSTISAEVQFASPVSHAKLKRIPEGYYSESDGFIFPVISGIPVFTNQNAILASHYGDLK